MTTVSERPSISSYMHDDRLETKEKLRANGNRLALELSRNDMDVRRVEDDAEKSTMRFLEYMSQRQEMLAKSKNGSLGMKDRDQLAKVADSQGLTDKTLKRCLQSEEVVRYWEALMSVSADGRRFFNTIHFSSKWSDKVIHQPGGGVSR